MKITFLVNQYARISGGNRALFEYANRLKRRGCEVRWFVMPPRVKWSRPLKKIKTYFADATVKPASSVDWMENSLPIEILPRKDAALIPDADVFVATAWQTAEFAATLAEKAGRKFYFIQHHESLWMRDQKTAEQTYQLPFQKIVISTWLSDLLREQYGQSAHILVTPVNNEVFYPAEKVWNTPRRVCMLHHDYDWKGFDDGIAAIRQTRAAGESVDLVAFGEKLEDPAPLFRKAGFEFEYHYRPTKEKLRDIYVSSDIYLCPSWHEGLGMPPMEAMACGSALVTTDTGGCRDYAINGETALVSPPKDATALSQNLLSLLRDEQLLFALAERGQKKILSMDWEANCDALLQLFKNNS